MFFPERIKSINASDNVLEIGPGSTPHPRADIFLEKRFGEEDSFVQRGFLDKIHYAKPIQYYDRLPFPFKEKEFDYVICSHVIEHVPKHELRDFFSELHRISKKGYLEFPNIFYELINYQDVHVWFMNYRNDEILFLDKSVFKTNFIHKIFREMFYCKNKYLSKTFRMYKEFFFEGFEWDSVMSYRIVNTFDELVNEEDFRKFQDYFDNMAETYKSC